MKISEKKLFIARKETIILNKFAKVYRSYLLIGDVQKTSQDLNF